MKEQKYSSGNLSGLLSIGLDITERRKAEEEIQNQNKFLNNVLESLKHPFLVIKTNDYSVELANSTAKGDSYFEGITCHELTHNSQEPCNSPEHICPLTEIKKKVGFKKGEFFVKANPTELNQVLMNLGVNAAQAIEQKGVNPGDYISINAEEYEADSKDPLFTTKDKGAVRGQGLGLAMVYNLITS